MKAVVLNQYNRVDWQSVKKPICQKDTVLIKVTYSAICGSDQHIFKGEFHPRTKPPLIIGHEFSGVVVEVGEDVCDFQLGDKVAPDPIIWCGECAACKKGHYPACTSLKLLGIDLGGGFCEYVALKPEMLYKVPGLVPDEHIALVEVLSIGCHAKNRAGVKKDDTVLIWGAGKVGLSILQAVRTVTENRVFLVDILDGRLALGAHYYDNVVTINPCKEDPVARIHQETNGAGVHVAFEAVGHAKELDGVVAPVRGCIKSIQGAGVVCVLGLGDEPVPVLFKELIWKEAKIVASRVSHGEFKETIDHLIHKRLKPEMLISKVLPASQAQSAFEILEKDPGNNIKLLLDFQA